MQRTYYLQRRDQPIDVLRRRPARRGGRRQRRRSRVRVFRRSAAAADVKPVTDPRGPWTTYGPRPPALGVRSDHDAGPAGENCTFESTAARAAAPRLPDLAPGSKALVLADKEMLTDGPWCPDDDALAPGSTPTCCASARSASRCACRWRRPTCAVRRARSSESRRHRRPAAARSCPIRKSGSRSRRATSTWDDRHDTLHTTAAARLRSATNAASR